VGLQVELAHPYLGVGIVPFGHREEVRWALDRYSRRRLEVGQPPSDLEHVTGGAAPTVAETERHKRPVGARLVGVVGRRACQLAGRQLSVVGIDGREVGEDSRAVDTLPPKGMVRHSIRFVPRQLLGQEPAEAGECGDLRICRAITEGVGQPNLLAVDTKLLEEEALTQRELANERFASG
jgi:hypothetical protein